MITARSDRQTDPVLVKKRSRSRPGAWAKAIGLCNNQAMGLVHIPENSIYYLHGRPESSERAEQEYKDIFYRLSYLAKKRTSVATRGFVALVLAPSKSCTIVFY
ncbi:YagK/YfjJ domain-containing protein [Salinivibrio costicola]|uniref:YagK/YfjJ domain-containing protein n=1 Tax=Salinivibrio costicola TaxID=51367 RepID=UPI000A902E36